MIDFKRTEEAVITGLEKATGRPVVAANQTSRPTPEYPYLSFTITSPYIANKGQYSVLADMTMAKEARQIWSVTAQSSDWDQAMRLILRARDFLEITGRQYLKDRDVVVEGVGNIVNRDNLLSVMYEHRNGFDVTFLLVDEIKTRLNGLNVSGGCSGDNEEKPDGGQEGRPNGGNENDDNKNDGQSNTANKKDGVKEWDEIEEVGVIETVIINNVVTVKKGKGE